MVPACTAPAATQSTSPDRTIITFMSFAAGTSGQVRMDAIAESVRLNHPELAVSSQAAGGEARLIEKRIAGAADFYNTMSPRALDLLVNTPLYPQVDFAAATDYLIVMPASSMYVHFLARGETQLDSPADIVARRYPAKIGSGVGVVRVVLAQMFEYYGTTLPETESWGARYETLMMAGAEGVEALEAGRIDAGITWGSLPQPALMGVSSNVKLLPVSDPGLVAHLEGLGCVPAMIPAGTYPFVTDDVATVAAPQYFVARPEMPDDVVYEVLKAIYDHAELLYSVHPEARSLLAPEGVSHAMDIARRSGDVFHPGALKYYRERGWIA
jgi:TRAP transporter TAXI family solute receptor